MHENYLSFLLFYSKQKNWEFACNKFTKQTYRIVFLQLRVRQTLVHHLA